MLYGIIYLGSNTIRLNVYECKEQTAQLLFSKKETIGILSYIKKGTLSEIGIQLLCDVLISFQKLLHSVDIINYSVFSTASLRNLKNKDIVLHTIKEKTKISIDVLSGETEGKLSFYGASHHISQQEGLFLDLGGGSCELVYFKNKKIYQVFSIPIGSLSMFQRYISKLLPKESEQKAIRQRVRKELDAHLPTDFPKEIPYLCAAGGSIRAIEALIDALYLKEPFAIEFPCNALDLMYANYKHAPKEVCHTILKARPDRIHTLLPGLFILSEIANYFHCERMQVSHYGVREGYLYERILELPS